MHDHNLPVVSSARPRWTEDRVERLLLALFAEEPVYTAPSVRSSQRHRPRHGLLVAAAAICLALIVPAMSARVQETSGEQSPLARWVGPLPASDIAEMNLASAENSDSTNADANESDGESDETAEAPRSTDTEDSAST